MMKSRLTLFNLTFLLIWFTTSDAMAIKILKQVKLNTATITFNSATANIAEAIVLGTLISKVALPNLIYEDAQGNVFEQNNSKAG